MLINELEQYISENQIDLAVKLVKIIGRDKQDCYLPYLIEILQETENKVLRNSIAIALADIGRDEAIFPLIEMIKNPKTLGSRGTLLYALESFNCSKYVDVFLDLLTGNGLEVSRHSYQILESISVNLHDNVKEECFRKLNDKMNELKHDIEILEDALELFD